MEIKIIGSILVLISGTLTGWYISLQYINRIKQLNQLQAAINFLDAEIGFTQTVLEDALKKTAKNIDYPISRIFYQASHRLSLKEGVSFKKIWIEEVEKNHRINSLTTADKQILIEWGQKIGTTGVEKQEKINQMVLKKLNQMQKKAQKNADKKVKFTRYSGILISLLIIILFY